MRWKPRTRPWRRHVAFDEPVVGRSPTRQALRCVAAAAIVAAAVLAGSAPAGAAADLELQFLDTRPIVIGLDTLGDEDERRWRVGVFNGEPGGPHRLTMHVLFDPVDAIVVERQPSEPVPTGAVAYFVIALDEEADGSGELVVTSQNGAVARRQISVVSSEEDAVPVGALRFSGTRSHPFGGAVGVGALDVPGAPGGSGDTVSIGSVVSGSGDVAHLVRTDDTFEVRGVDGTGEYRGTADLTPGADGGEAEITLEVRDAAGWPLALLLAGLGAVQGLERYQKRVRPRRELALRLAHLKDRARVVQEAVGGRLLVCKEPGQSDLADLALDRETADALAAWGKARTEAAQSVWEFGGAAFSRLADAVDEFARLAHEYTNLESRRNLVVTRSLVGDRGAAQQALEGSSVGQALRPRAFTNLADIARAAEELEAAAACLDRFSALYEQLEQLARSGDDEVRAGAEVLRSKLLTPGVDLDPLEEEVEALLKVWRPAPTRVAEEHAGVAAPAASAPAPAPARARPAAVPPASPAPIPIARAGKRRLALPLAAGSVAVVLGALLAVSMLGGQQADFGDSAGGGQSGAGSGAGDGAAPSTTLPQPPEELPDAPVTAPSPAPPAAIPDANEDDDGSVVVWGFVVPMAVTLALVGAALLVVRRLRRRPRTDDLDSARLDRLLALDDARFALASAVFVVATGMSLLYVPNPTFGSPGDYLTVALWGAGVGEGIQLARRILPGLPGR